MKVTSIGKDVSFCATTKYCCVDIGIKNEKIRITNIEATQLRKVLSFRLVRHNALHKYFGARYDLADCHGRSNIEFHEGDN